MVDFTFEGYGASATGGAGGTEYTVTTWADMKTRLEQSGARIIRFSGTITATSQATIDNDDFTLEVEEGKWGQIITDGVIQTSAVRIRCDNFIVSRVAFRAQPSSTNNNNQDTVNVNGGTNGMFNRCSFYWGVDEIVDVFNNGATNSSNITFQWCIFAEALYEPYPGLETPLSKGLLCGSSSGNASNITVHHCLFAHIRARVPRFAACDGGQVINCVLYNTNGTGNDPIQAASSSDNVDVINCYYKKGTDTVGEYILDANDAGPLVYYNGNTCDNCTSFQEEKNNTPASEASPLNSPATAVTTTTSTVAFDEVLANAGTGDITDQRIIKDVCYGTGAIIDDPTDVGDEDNIDNDLGLKVTSIATTVSTPEAQIAIVEFYEAGTLVHTDSFDFILDTTDRWVSFRAMIDRFVAGNASLLVPGATDNSDTSESTDTDDPNGWIADQGIISHITDRILQVS